MSSIIISCISCGATIAKTNTGIQQGEVDIACNRCGTINHIKASQTENNEQIENNSNFIPYGERLKFKKKERIR